MTNPLLLSRKTLVLLGCLMIQGVLYPADTLTTKVSLSKTLMNPTAEIIHLRIDVTYARQDRIRIHQFSPDKAPAQLYAQFLIKKDSTPARLLRHISYAHTRKVVSTQIQESFMYAFQVFEVENLFLSPIHVLLLQKNQEYSFYTPTTFIHVLPPPENIHEGDVQNIYQPDRYSLDVFEYAQELVVGALCLIVGGILWYVGMHLRRYFLYTRNALRDPHFHAYASLNDLEAVLAQAHTDINIQSCYQVIAHTLKRFIERQYLIRTLENTPQETLTILTEKLYPHPWKPELLDLFQSLTSLSYSQRHSSIAHVHKDLSRTKKLIEIMHRALQ